MATRSSVVRGLFSLFAAWACCAKSDHNEDIDLLPWTLPMKDQLRADILDETGEVSSTRILLVLGGAPDGEKHRKDVMTAHLLSESKLLGFLTFGAASSRVCAFLSKARNSDVIEAVYADFMDRLLNGEEENTQRLVLLTFVFSVRKDYRARVDSLLAKCLQEAEEEGKTELGTSRKAFLVFLTRKFAIYDENDGLHATSTSVLLEAVDRKGCPEFEAQLLRYFAWQVWSFRTGAAEAPIEGAQGTP